MGDDRYMQANKEQLTKIISSNLFQKNALTVYGKYAKRRKKFQIFAYLGI